MNRMEFNRKTSESVIMEKNKGELKYLQYPSLCETGVCRHLFSTRLGGVSEGDIGTMNLSYSRGDKKENVDENFRRIADALDSKNVDYRMLVLPDHPTPICVRTHTSDPVPYMLFDSTDKKAESYDYNEKDAKATGTFIANGHEAILHLFEK